MLQSHEDQRGHDKSAKCDQLGRGEKVALQGTSANADVVHYCQDTQHRCENNHPGQLLLRRRPELRQIGHK